MGRKGPGANHQEDRMITLASNYFMMLVAKSRTEEGATATEYIILLVFIALAIVVGATALGAAINGRFGAASTEVGTLTTSN
jgi:pilus assembly protein Flp/PilA